MVGHPHTPCRRSEARGVAPLLTIDPDLGDGLDSEELADARRLLVRIVESPPGPWVPPDEAGAGVADLGLLVADGLLMRGVMIGDTRCTELLGHGDILRPWAMDANDYSSVPVEADWRVVESPARFAVIDRDVSSRLARRPAIIAQLFDRSIRRARWLSFQLAVCHTQGIDTRLLMVLWHFADRWGRVTPDGTVVELQLSHRTLGQIVGARRPTVTSALGRLRRRGLLSATEGGRWLLLGEPPEFVRRDVPALDSDVD